MAEKFDNIVKRIANEYINSILFVDEQAFSPSSGSSVPKDKQKELDVAAVSRAFSNAGKICGFFAPKTLEDIEKCKQLIFKPDIVVLDWDIQIDRVFSKEEESQDDETDDRGHYSVELIKSIASDAKNEKLKVIFVYTGEIGLHGIVSKIADSLGDGFVADEDKFEVSSGNIHIIIRLKPDSNVSHIGLDGFKVSYADLPKAVMDAFSKYVSGLMPCFAMRSMSAIRDCAARVLQVYNSELDAELLGHQLALSNPNDAKSYLTNSFGSAVSELLLDNPSINTDEWVEEWVDSRFSAGVESRDFIDTRISLTPSSVKDFFSKRLSTGTLSERFNDAFKVNCRAGKDKISKKLSTLFHKEGDDVERAKYLFAALAHHKNIFSNHITAPILTQGTIIKSKTDYYLCIQQRCDTMRVKSGGLDFLFVPLYGKENKKPSLGAIALGTNDVRYIQRSSVNFMTIHFSPLQDGHPIEANLVGGRYVFTNAAGEYEWVNELKDIFAQRIVTALTSHFSRVGVDEAEWLRIEGSDAG